MHEKMAASFQEIDPGKWSIQGLAAITIPCMAQVQT